MLFTSNAMFFLHKNQKQKMLFFNLQDIAVIIKLSRMFRLLKSVAYQDHLQIRSKMGFWDTCCITPLTLADSSYIHPHCWHYHIMLSDSNEVVYFPRHWGWRMILSKNFSSKVLISLENAGLERYKVNLWKDIVNPMKLLCF